MFLCKQLFEENLHEWKIIPLYIIRIFFGANFKFHSNLDISNFLLKTLELFYQEILTGWSKYSSSPISILSTITFQFL